MYILYSVIGMLSTKIYKKMLRYIAGKGMGFASSNGEALKNVKKCDSDHEIINNYVIHF